MQTITRRKTHLLDQCRKALLVYPRFSGSSFWNYRETCEVIGAKHPAPPLGLITVAALLPASWDLRLVDRNIDDLSAADVAWADVILTGGMLPQQADTLAIVELAHGQAKPVVVGGPDVTSSPDRYASADFRVLGEAEGVIDDFVLAYLAGHPNGLFESPKFQVDVTRSPIPRFDLLNFNHYVQIGVQFSRGCPFTCEFCDIIELYGRKPRAKTTAQMLAELERLYQLGYRGHVDFVDDNLIGNKKAVKNVLPALREWQERKGFPFEFSTEASLNLADDTDLLGMMKAAAFFAVFIGIETPDTATLMATGKKQNTRGPIADSIARIYQAGLFVLAGFIVGFDDEHGDISEPMIRLIEEAAIPVCMVGLLYALPNTQLTRRLQQEGRLFRGHDVDAPSEGSADQCTSGLNFVTRRPRKEVLSDYRRVIAAVYRPDRYFGRVERMARALKLDGPSGSLHLATLGKDLRQFARLLWHVPGHLPGARRYFWVTLFRCVFANPRSIKPVLKALALYVHLGVFAQVVEREITRQISTVGDPSNSDLVMI
jgi:radical SAM superfamily enzyme YgiQ (UPF0313 family)